MKVISCAGFCVFAIVLLAVISPVAGNAQNKKVKKTTEVNFIEGSFSAALKQAKAQKKYIFVDAYASWCGPCQLLKATTFKNNKVASFYNDNFINVSIDMEKGEGPALAQQWGIQAYPTLIVFNSTGKPVLGTMGYLKPAQILRFGVQALNK